MKPLLILAALLLTAAPALAWDNDNDQSNGNGYVNPSHSYTNGYTRQNGTYVNGYQHTSPNHTTSDNYGTSGNTNPWTGERGSHSYGGRGRSGW